MSQFPKYPLLLSDEYSVIEFVSIGIKGRIDKVIYFQPTENPIIYNLGFGDKIKNPESQEIEFDDSVNSENGDRDIVLATVAAAVSIYTKKHLERWVYFAGSNDIRTRLYRMAITKNYSELCIEFDIFGVTLMNNALSISHFDSKVNYLGFIIKRKI